MSDRIAADVRRPIDATDAAFAGFRLVRERPTLFFGLMVLIVILGLITSLVQVTVAGPALTRLMELQAARVAGTPPDPAATFALMGPVWEANALILPLVALFYAVTNAAVYRAMLRPAEGGFGFLRFGADEFRQLGTLLLVGLTLFGVIVATEIGAIILGVIAGVALGGGHGGGGGAIGVVALLLIAAVLAAVLLVAVKLSLAGPMTFAERRVRVTGSWALTRGRFWPMLGAYVLASVIITLAAIVVLTLACLFAYMTGGIPAVRGLFFADSSTFTSFFTVERIVLMVLNAPIGALWIGIQAAVPAALYAQIAGAPPPVDVGPDRSHAFGAQPVAPPPPDKDYPITPRDI